MSLSLREKKIALVDKPSVCGHKRSVYMYIHIYVCIWVWVYVGMWVYVL